MYKSDQDVHKKSYERRPTCVALGRSQRTDGARGSRFRIFMMDDRHATCGQAQETSPKPREAKVEARWRRKRKDKRKNKGLRSQRQVGSERQEQRCGEITENRGKNKVVEAAEKGLCDGSERKV